MYGYTTARIKIIKRSWKLSMRLWQCALSGYAHVFKPCTYWAFSHLLYSLSHGPKCSPIFRFGAHFWVMCTDWDPYPRSSKWHGHKFADQRNLKVVATRQYVHQVNWCILLMVKKMISPQLNLHLVEDSPRKSKVNFAEVIRVQFKHASTLCHQHIVCIFSM